MKNDATINYMMESVSRLVKLEELTSVQMELVLAMCYDDSRGRLQMPTAVSKLDRFAEIETENFTQHAGQPDPASLVNFDLFDALNGGNTSFSWTELQRLVMKSENDYYQQMCGKLELVFDTLRAGCHPWPTLQRFHDLLEECKYVLDTMSKQNQVRRLSATRARDHSVQGLYRRVSQLLQLVLPQEHDGETQEAEWKHLCREQVEVFVSEASEACVLLSSVDSEEDRLALVAVLRAEMHNSDGKYTEKQLAVLQKSHDDIVSKSLEDVHLVTAPEWFIPWFELKMNEMTLLGEGGFGSVIKAKWLDSEVVVKKLDIADNDAADVGKKHEMRQMFEREVDIWFGLSHPHVVRLFDELWSKLREAALGVQYLHARGIVHGDLKCNNILIGSDGKAKVTDFGLSGVFGDDSAEMMVSGAWNWVAPECLLGEKPTFASDTYSLGMCIIEALRVTNGDKDYIPWRDLLNAEVKFQVTEKHLLPQRPANCSDETWTLIERMCKSDPIDRMLIMTVVDELEEHAGQYGDLGGETDQIVSDNGEIRLLRSSVANTLAEMQNWIKNCVAKQDLESGVLEKIYQLLWDRLKQVAIQLFPDGDGSVVANTTISDFTSVVERSQMRTRATLGITGVIPLIKFTELAFGGYALHRRLDKFMVARKVSKDTNSLHDWMPACSMFMKVRAFSTLACSEDDCSMDEEAGGGRRMVSSTEMAAVLYGTARISIVTDELPACRCSCLHDLIFDCNL